jgi:periplasmic protein TonB
MLAALPWLLSIGVHAGFALFMLLPAGGAAIEEGTGDDIMVVEQGLAIQGVAKLGEDVITVDPIEAPPVQVAAAQPLPEEVKPVVEEELPVEEKPKEVKPIEEQQVITSEAGPDQENVAEPKPEEIKEPKPKEVVEPKRQEVKEPEPEEVKEEQPKPQQLATVAPQESVAARLESSGQEKKGGDTTAHRAYLGKLRTHLERSKVNPRTTLIGTAIVRLMVGSNGELLSHEIVKSSGSKALDEAAIASIERASPFPPIPKDLDQKNIEVSVPYRFSVR